MRKSSIVTCCVIFCLLSAVPQNRGAKLLESLSCFLQFPDKIFVCSWLENNVSGKLLNLTLMHKKEPVHKFPMNYSIACPSKAVINSSQTHSTWTCNVPWGNWVASDNITFSFAPERNLRTRLNVVEERDEAKPQNLQCNDSEGNIACSWQIREEIVESIDFDLFYDNDEKECQPQCQQGNSKYLSCHCNIMTDGHLNISALLNTINVKPRKLERSSKSFKLCLIYKLAPRNLTINETNQGEVFVVTWKNPKTEENKSFKYNYELCYWNESELKLEKIPDICPADPIKIHFDHEPSMIFQLNNQLKPNSNYSIMIRVRLNETRESYCYHGPWSEWSEVKTLTTKPVPNLILLYVLIPISVIVLVLFAFCGYRALARYTKQWNERIPNPNKSAIIKGFQKTKASIAFSDRLVMRCVTLQNGPYVPYGEHLYVEPYNNIMMWTSSGSKDSPHAYQNIEHISRLDSDLTSDEEIEGSTICDMTKDDYPTASVVDGYKPFTDLEEEQESEDIKDSQFTFSAFDGPYLFSENNLS